MRRALVASLLIHAVALAWLPWNSAPAQEQPVVRFASAALEPASEVEPRLPDPPEPQPEPQPAMTFEERVVPQETEHEFPRIEPRLRLARPIRVSAQYKVKMRARPASEEPAATAPPPPQEFARRAPPAPTTAPRVRKDGQAPPRYPAVAKRRAWQGTVLLELRINAEGVVDSVVLRESSGYDLLDREAMRAVRAWRYEPGTRDGRPIAATLLQPVEFRLR